MFIEGISCSNKSGEFCICIMANVPFEQDGFARKCKVGRSKSVQLCLVHRSLTEVWGRTSWKPLRVCFQISRCMHESRWDCELNKWHQQWRCHNSTVSIPMEDCFTCLREVKDKLTTTVKHACIQNRIALKALRKVNNWLLPICRLPCEVGCINHKDMFRVFWRQICPSWI